MSISIWHSSKQFSHIADHSDILSLVQSNDVCSLFSIPPPLLYSLSIQGCSQVPETAQEPRMGGVGEAWKRPLGHSHPHPSAYIHQHELFFDQSFLYFEGYGDFLRLSQWKATPCLCGLWNISKGITSKVPEDNRLHLMILGSLHLKTSQCMGKNLTPISNPVFLPHLYHHTSGSFT